VLGGLRNSSIPASFALSVPGMKKPTGARQPSRSSPITAVIASVWLSAASIARRTATLAVGPTMKLGRNTGKTP
jgi:hypothetical protein